MQSNMYTCIQQFISTVGCMCHNDDVIMHSSSMCYSSLYVQYSVCPVVYMYKLYVLNTDSSRCIDVSSSLFPLQWAMHGYLWWTATEGTCINVDTYLQWLNIWVWADSQGRHYPGRWQDAY